MGDLKNPTLSLLAYTGDLGMDDGTGQSVYVLDKAKATLLTKPDGSMFRVDLQEGQTVELPDGAGTVSFDGVQRWNRIQISRTPGMHVALAGVVLSLVGLLASLFIRPRRVWVRARRSEDDGDDGGRGRRAGPLDGRRRGGRGGRRGERPARVAQQRARRRGEAVTDQAWETLSNQAVAAAGLLYFLSLLAYLVQWASLRHVPVVAERKVAVGAGGLDKPDRQEDDEGVSRRAAMTGRLGLVLATMACAVQFVALLGRGMAADPNRVPWGNMYEFTLAGTFVVAFLFLVLRRRSRSTGWDRWSSPSC